MDPLLALRDGDPGPFEELVRRHTGTLLAFFRRQGAGAEEAEDLVQDVMLKLHRSAATYRAEERLAAYVFRVATHALIDRHRRRGAQPPRAPLVESELATHEDPAASIGRRDEELRLRAAIAELPETHRLVVELGAIEGLSYSEIGALLEVPVGTVKSRMYHAVRKLRDALDGALDGAPGGVSGEERGEA